MLCVNRLTAAKFKEKSPLTAKMSWAGENSVLQAVNRRERKTVKGSARKCFNGQGNCFERRSLTVIRRQGGAAIYSLLIDVSAVGSYGIFASGEQSQLVGKQAVVMARCVAARLATATPLTNRGATQ